MTVRRRRGRRATGPCPSCGRVVLVHLPSHRTVGHHRSGPGWIRCEGGLVPAASLNTETPRG